MFERGTGGGIRDIARKYNSVTGSTIQSNGSGEFGPYITLDGSSNYIHILDSLAGGHPYTGLSDNWSVAVRFRATAVTGGPATIWIANRTLVELRQENTTTNVPFAIGIDNSKAFLGVASSDTPERCVGTATLNANQWYLLVVTMNGDDWKIYLDGKLDASGTLATATGDRSVGSTACNLAFGAHPRDTGVIDLNFFTGDMDHVGIWGRTLTDSDVRVLAADPFEVCRAIYPTLPGLFSFPALSRQTVTLLSFDPADGSTRAETTDEIIGDFAPVNYLLNPIDTITATVNGVSVSVDTDLIAGGEVVGTIDYPFIHGRTYEVVWTVTTADSVANIFTQTFTVRSISHTIERAELVIPRMPRTFELATLNVLAPPRGTVERVDMYVNPRPGATFERCEVDVVAGLSPGNRTWEGADVIAAEYVFVNDWAPFSFDTGPGDSGGLEVAFDTIGHNVVPVLPISMTTKTREHEAILPVAMDVGLGESSEIPLALDTGPGATSELPLAFDTSGDAIQSIDGRANLRNEDQAAEEDG